MIKREIFEDLKRQLNKDEIILIVGPRQAGKTFLMIELKKYLDSLGEKTLFLNLDIERDAQFFELQEKLIKKIELEIGKTKGFIFIDEIQRKENAGLFLKGIYDMNLPYKFIVSGSGSVELKEKIHESLAGRKIIFELGTVSFKEFVNYKTGYKYEDKLDEFFEIENQKSYQFLEEYLNFGGYPRVILNETLTEKLMVISDIFQSYLEKDIFYLLGIKKKESFTNLVKIVSAQIGRMINYNEISQTLGISFETLKDYLWYLEKTFIIKKITPFFRNIRKEITKMPVYYFYDLGLRNYAINAFGNAVNLSDTGFLFQNFVFNLIKSKNKFLNYEIHYWRTKDGGEVDFIVETGMEIIPYEVKFAKLRKPLITKSLMSFIKNYAPKKAYVVNLSLEKTEKINGTRVEFMPYYKLI